jgi:hypothetical protein
MPNLPTVLRDEINRGRCILFVGAGASMDAVDANGHPLPHWGMLLTELVDLIQDSTEPDPSNIVDEIQTMLNYGDFMPIAEWIDHRLGDARFRKHLIARLATAKYSQVHEILSSKPFRAVITTNYDRLIEIHWEQKGKNPFVVIPQKPETIATASDVLDGADGMTPIIRAHGGLNDPSSLIFFPRTYRDIMFRNEAFRQFMSMVFRRFTVLFVGMSFRDPNLQSLLQWIYTLTEGKEREQYAILDGKGQVFKNYMKKNYNLNFITYDAPGGDHSALRDLLDSI